MSTTLELKRAAGPKRSRRASPAVREAVLPRYAHKLSPI